MKYQWLILSLITLSGSMFTISGCGAENAPCPETNCSDYSSRLSAQAAFDSDPECFADLDHDSDGRACEQFKGYEPTTTACPTTANCGCSNKRKSDCAGACCQWIVGDGCQCQ